MPAITYSEMNSSFFMKGEQYELFTEDMTDDMRNEFLCSLIHSAIADSYVNRLFTTFAIYDPSFEVDENGEKVLDDEGEPIPVDGYLEYELSYSIEPTIDKHFLLDVIGYGMLLGWATPIVYSSVNFRQMYGTSAEKFYAQQTHMSVTQEMLEKISYAQRKLIRDRGYTRNAYLDGDAQSARLRSSSE